MSNIFWVVGVIFFILAMVLFSAMKLYNYMMRRRERKINEKTKGDENELMKPKDDNEV